MNSLLDKTRRNVLLKTPHLCGEIQRLVAADNALTHAEALATTTGRGECARTPEQIALAMTSRLRRAAGSLGDEFARSPGVATVLASAAMVLLCDDLDAAERAGARKTSPAFLTRCTNELMANVLQLLGVTTKKVDEAIAHVSWPASMYRSGVMGLAAARVLLARRGSAAEGRA